MNLMKNDLKGNVGAKEMLCGEILARARAESVEIIRLAEAEAENILKRAGEDAQKARRELLEAAGAEAARRKELILAAVPVEAARLRSAKIEALLKTIRDEAARRLAVPPAGTAERKGLLIELAAEAVSRLAGGAVVLEFSPADFRELGADLAGAVARRAARPESEVSVVEDPSVADGGVIVRDAEGRQVWDNRLPSRLERMWPELRRLVAVKTGLLRLTIASRDQGTDGGGK